MTFDQERLGRLHDVMDGHVRSGEVTGLAWAVARGGDVQTGTAGTMAAGGAAVRTDSIFRISSMTKPVTAVAALVLVEECRLRLDDPVDDLLPELADRRVLARSDGPIDDTVPANRPITVRDVLTFELGLGFDFGAAGPQPVIEAMFGLGLGAMPPAPSMPPEPDEWMRRLGTLPLALQPGERWLYDTGAEVLGVLVARASGQPFDQFLRGRVLEPLGMTDTAFWVSPDDLDRFGPCRETDPATGTHRDYDPADGQWARPPAFPSGGGGLASTIDDYLTFARMLHAGGVHGAVRILSPTTVQAMTTDQLRPGDTGPDPEGAIGWGFGVGVLRRGAGVTQAAGSYGWEGGLGSSWANDPVNDVVGVILTNQMSSSPVRPPVIRDFWTCVYAAVV
jgi:CubicO group peptidase (beta-lactamase class C family)